MIESNNRGLVLRSKKVRVKSSHSGWSCRRRGQVECFGSPVQLLSTRIPTLTCHPAPLRSQKPSTVKFGVFYLNP